MDDPKRLARVAGLWYLAMAVSGPIGILWAPSQVTVAGDAAATAAALVENATVARVGVLASVVCQISFIALVLALVRLFDGVNDKLSRLMHGLVIAAVPVALTNELLVLGALEVAHRGGDVWLTLALLNVHELAVTVLCGYFWGLWLLPFGLLCVRSARIPTWLGVLIFIGGCSYIIDATLALLTPSVRASVSDFLLLPLAAGELSMVVWLLVWGVRTPKRS